MEPQEPQEPQELRINRFDQVKIITTKNVTYVSAPPSTEISPDGLWSVTAVVDNNELLLAKQSILVRIPVADVLVVAGYDIDEITKNFGRLSYGEAEKRKRNSEKL